MSQLMGHTERRISQRIEGATRCHRSPQPKELLICRSRETYHNVSKVFVEWPWPRVVRWPLVATFSRSCKLNCTDHFGHVNPTICRPCSRLSLCSSVKTKPDKLHLLSNAFLMIKFDFAGVRVWSLDTETYSCSFFHCSCSDLILTSSTKHVLYSQNVISWSPCLTSSSPQPDGHEVHSGSSSRSTESLYRKNICIHPHTRMYGMYGMYGMIV